MKNEVLYRKYRPKNFDELVGHSYFKSIIIKEIEKKNLSHALLLNGQRGTGKTSAARLIAKSYSCIDPYDGYKCCDKCKSCIMYNENSHPDIYEIDAASNNGVDEIRNIKENISSSPIISRYKIYIIDEVHMLTTNAFNAFLKTLEEPPSFVIFILATTEIHLVPQTILSRCQLYNFMKLNYKEIEGKIKEICIKENIKLNDEVIMEIYNTSEGSMRDALNILEQLKNFNLKEISINDYNKIFVSLTQKEKISFIEILLKKDFKNAIYKIKNYEEKGINFKNLIISLINILKSYIQFNLTKDKTFLETITEDQVNIFEKYKNNNLIELTNNFIKIYEEQKNSPILSTVMLMNSLKQNSFINEIINDEGYNTINQKKELLNTEVNKNTKPISDKEVSNFNINNQIKIKEQKNNPVLEIKDDIIFNIIINRNVEEKLKFEKIIKDNDSKNLGVLNFLKNIKIIAAKKNAFVFMMKKNEKEDVFNNINLINDKDIQKNVVDIFGEKIIIIQIYHSRIDYYKNKVEIIKSKFNNFELDVNDFYSGKYFNYNKFEDDNLKELKSIFPKLEVK